MRQAELSLGSRTCRLRACIQKPVWLLGPRRADREADSHSRAVGRAAGARAKVARCPLAVNPRAWSPSCGAVTLVFSTGRDTERNSGSRSAIRGMVLGTVTSSPHGVQVHELILMSRFRALQPFDPRREISIAHIQYFFSRSIDVFDNRIVNHEYLPRKTPATPRAS